MDQIDKCLNSIESEYYFVLPCGKITVCVISINDGSIVSGCSQNAANKIVNSQVGERIALENAIGNLMLRDGIPLNEILNQVKR